MNQVKENDDKKTGLSLLGSRLANMNCICEDVYNKMLFDEFIRRSISG